MTVSNTEVLKVNVAVVDVQLLRERQQVVQFSKQVETEMPAPVSGIAVGDGSMGPSQRFEMPRDRIALEISPWRSVIECAFPDKGMVKRMSEVVYAALNLSDVNTSGPIDYEYLVEMTYTQDSGKPSEQYLADALLRPGTISISGLSAVGGSARLNYNSPSGLITIILEPRFNRMGTNKVFLGMNLRTTQTGLPQADQIYACFITMWEYAEQIAACVDGGQD